MKKTIYLILCTCASLLAVQCNKFQEKDIDSEACNSGSYMELRGDEVYMSISVGEGTKTTINADRSVQWKKNDTIFVYAPTEGCLGHLIAEEAGSSVNFIGTVASWAGTQNIQFYYLGSGKLAKGATTYSYDITKQDGTLEGIASKLHLMHGVAASLAASTKHFDNVNMSSLIALAKFDLTQGGFETTYPVQCQTITTATLNLADGTFTSQATGKINMSAPSANYYAAFIPTSQSFKFYQSGNQEVVFNAKTALAANQFCTDNGNAIVVKNSGNPGDYAEEGTSYGPGIEINGVIWAPVNCGVGYNYAYPYGKLYQWGRHDGCGYNNGSTYKEVLIQNYTNTRTADPESTKFYSNNFDWYNGSTALITWPLGSQTPGYLDSKIDNPCPEGWRVPTMNEYLTLLGGSTSTAETSTWETPEGSISGRRFYGNTSKTGNSIFFPAAGYRDSAGDCGARGTYGEYWSSAISTTTAKSYSLKFTSGIAATSAQQAEIARAFGMTIRCVKDEGEYVSFGETTENAGLSGVSKSSERNKYLKITFTPQSDNFERINIPIRGLEVGSFYTISFSEKITSPSSAPYWTKKSGVYSTSVRPSPVTSTSESKMLNYDTSDGKYFVWTHSFGEYDSSPYTSTEEASTTFKATGETMYWVWEMSKFLNDAQFTVEIKLLEGGLKRIDSSSAPQVELWNSEMTNYLLVVDTVSPFKGAATNRIFADKSRFDLVTYGQEGKSEFINIPITGLKIDREYTLKFDYTRSDVALYSSHDFCFGVKASKVTSGSSLSGTDGYTDKITDLTFTDKTIKFKASASTMYWVWCQGALTNNLRCEQSATNVSIK